MSIELLRELIRENLDELSDNLLNRLDGFIEEVQRLMYEIIENSGVGSIWKDRKDGGSKIVKSSMDQLIHLIGEFESLSKFIEKQYNDKSVSNTITSLVGSLNSMIKSGSGLRKLFSGGENYIESLRQKRDEVETRIRACKVAVKRLKEKTPATKPFEFDFNNF